MELNEQDKALVSDLINVAWSSGAVKNPQMAQLVENLRAKLQKPKEQPKKETKQP
jgi:DNA-binding winged helix-turn-helix (wHTH) protein